MSIRLIIFDLDGTLVNSIGDITNALNYGLEPYGVEGLAPAEVAGMVGEGTLKLIENMLAKYHLTLDKDALIKRFREHYSSHLIDNTVAYPEVIETLKALKDYRKAVVSNKYEAFSHRTLDELGLSKYFDMVVCADTTNERKPSPVPIFHVLTTLDVKPEEAIIVGDSRVDISAGKASSLRTVAVTYGYGRGGFQEDADFAINKMSELIDIVKGIE